MDDRLDVLDYILLLPDLVMKRNLERCQRLEYHSDIYLRPASDTEMYIRKFQTNEVFNQIQDLLTGRRPSREIRAFVESIGDDINRALPWQTQHVFQTFLERAKTGLSDA